MYSITKHKTTIVFLVFAGLAFYVGLKWAAMKAEKPAPEEEAQQEPATAANE